MPNEIEIWLLSLRKAFPGYYPVYCILEKDIPKPLYQIPSSPEELKKDQRVVSGWGHHFFWSQKEKTFVIQLLLTFEYSERIEVEQFFLSGENFVITKHLTGQNVIMLPTAEFQEVFPEMNPDRSRLD